MIDFNTEPYNDDYDENKKFYRILYRPSFAVQARELTQMQTILQAQISRHGSAIFKQGAMVIPGQSSVETFTSPNKGVDYVKLQPLYNGVAVETFVNNIEGMNIVGSSGLTAQIVKVQNQESSDPTTLFIRYTNSGTNSTTKVFANNEVITTADAIYSFQAVASAATGKGSTATIERGVYYVNGQFILCDTQTLILDKYTATPTYRIGLSVVESVVTPEQDETLLDNAQNSYNFAAPGAHRYFIDLILSKRSITDTDDKDFVEVIRVTDGVIDTIVKTTAYSQVANELARRTYDESGDYTVNGFTIDIREHRTNDRGAWIQNTAFLIGDIVTNAGYTYVAQNSGSSVTTAPTHTTGNVYDGPGATGINWQYNEKPSYNRGIYLNGDESKVAVGIEAGKAYVRGFELEKTGTTYIPVSKARDFSQSTNAVVPAAVGNYVLVTNVNNLPAVDEYATVSLRNQATGSGSRGSAVGTEIGTARVRFIEWHTGLPFGTTSVYKLGLFDVQMNAGKDFNRNVKSFYYTATSFTADINPITIPLIGSVTASTTSLTGTGTSFQTDLIAGDYIVVDGAMVLVSAIASQSDATISSSTFTGKAYALATTQILEPGNSSLVYPLPYYAIRSMRQAGTGGQNNTIYQCYQKFTQAASGTSLTLSTSGTFATQLETDNYICIDNVSGAVFTPTSITPTGSTCSIIVPSGQSGRSISVVANIIKTGGGFEKTKTLTTVTGIAAGSTNTFTTAATAQTGTILLEHADVYRIISIKMAPTVALGSTPTNNQYTEDISDRFDFDNGQRATHYDLGRLTLKASFAPPSNPFRVEYEYFEHGSGDYCSVNSYGNIAYKDIPQELRDAIDFRPKVATKSSSSTRNFIGSGSSTTATPKRGVDITSDFSYYLPRKDIVALDSSGQLSDISGVSALIPGDPKAPALGMTLYCLVFEPYTFGVDDNNVNATKIENKRYTMRDIGKLETRISNLEYYTSLSMLEQETQSLKISDDTGLDRLKNGFIVDNFTGNKIGDYNSVDYYCSIDSDKNELRPFYAMNNVNLIEKNSNNTQRAASNYQISGDILHLPIIDNPILVKQEYASRLENINPFAIFTFLGNVSFNPPTDDWFETTQAPDVINPITAGNYDTIRALALKAGEVNESGMGTVWGAWQDSWVGQTYETPRTYTSAAGRNWVGYNIIQNFATPTGQTRNGIQTKLVEKIDKELVSDRVISTAVIPYIRSRNVLVQVKGLKPNTRFYPWFNDIDITSYVTPTVKLTYTTISGIFDFKTNVGGSASETKRRITSDSQVCLNKGDVISNSGNTASGVVVGMSLDNSTGARVLELSNVIGTFSNGQQFTGSVSGAIGTVVGSPVTSTTLITNSTGDLNFIFNIPNNDSVRFRTGSAELKLLDVSTLDGQFTSKGTGKYVAKGVLQTQQATYNSVRNAELVKEQITSNQTIFPTTSRQIGTVVTAWWDPLAQSFLVQQPGGAFLTKIDVFFASKDANIPCSLEIREMVNGYPGKIVLPFSKVVLNPDQVNLSSTSSVIVNGPDADASYPTFDTPTSFVFSTPVYVQDSQEYCFVLQSDSNNYKVWISNMGDTIPGTSRTISEQPYAGVMFKSQNASTWTADQDQDIKFSIYRAKFNTQAVGNIEFVNDVLPYQTIENNPFQFVTGSTTVRVWHKDHGMIAGSSVIIAGSTGTINGVPSAELNGTKTIANVDMNSYTITVTTSATVNGYAGGSVIRATKNIQYDIVNPTIQMQTFSDTYSTFSIKSTSGKAVDGSQTPYTLDSAFSPCLVKENNEFTSPRMIASEINENTLLAGNKSVTFSARISTSNDSLSPVIDTTRASLIAISNKINYASESNVNVSALDVKTIFTHATGAFTFNVAGTITSTVSGIRTLLPNLSVGKYITVSGSASNNGTYLVTGYIDNGTTGTLTVDRAFTSESSTTGTTVQLRELFLDDISPVGSSTLSKYTTAPIKLANSSTFTRIRFAYNIPAQADVLVYYKTCTGENSQLNSTKYTLATSDSSIVKVELGDDKFYDAEYTLTDMAPFDTIVVKLVMKSTNSSAVPRIKDFRVIACA